MSGAETGIIQVVVLPGVQQPLRDWLASRGQYLYQIPLQDDPLPTFGIGTADPAADAGGKR